MRPLDGREEGGDVVSMEEHIRGKFRKSYKMDEEAART